MTIDLNAPGVAKQVARQIVEDIDEYCIRAYDGGHRNHLGGSLIGDPCKRKLWYIFRWCFRMKPDGRLQRLFNRGHREEERFVEWLKGIGCQVWAEDENGDQFRISDCFGHFGGSLDGVAILPERYGIPGPVLLEFKTNGTGRAFNKLNEDGMAIAKPLHFAQTSTYGYKYGFAHCLYLNINKNDDSLHAEIVKLSPNLAEQCIQKAGEIISSQSAPPRLSDNPDFQDCRWCDAKDICHKGAIVEKNCRSCMHARPIENAQWFCDLNNGVIPADFIPQGCDNYEPITLRK